MSSQGHLRYPQQPPPSSSANDFRLPSLKDLNFQYRPLPVTNTHEHATEQTQQYTDFVPQDQPANNSSSSNSNNNNNNNNNTTTTNNNSNGGSNTFAYSYPSYQAHASPWSPPSSTNRTTPLVPTTLPHYHASNTDASPPARPDARVPPAYVPSIAAATRPHPASPDSRYSQHPAESRYPSAHAQEPRYHVQPPPSADSRPTTGYSTTTELKPTLISSTPAAATDSRTSYDQNARSAYDQLGRTSFEQNGRSSYEANRVGYEQPARPTYDQNTRVAYEQSPRSGYDPVPRSNTGYDTTNARPPAVRTNNSPQGYIPANTRTPHESSRPAFAPPSGDITRAPSELQRAYVSPVDLRQYPPAQSRQTYPAAEARSAYPAADARSGYPPADVRPTYALPETRIAYPAADARPVYTADGRIADARPVYSPVATSAPEQRSRHGNGNSQEHLHPERYAPPQAVTQDKHAPQPLQPSERYPGPHSQSQPQERYAPQQADRYASQQPDRYVQHQQHSDNRTNRVPRILIQNSARKFRLLPIMYPSILRPIPMPTLSPTILSPRLIIHPDMLLLLLLLIIMLMPLSCLQLIHIFRRFIPSRICKLNIRTLRILSRTRIRRIHRRTRTRTRSRSRSRSNTIRISPIHSHSHIRIRHNHIHIQHNHRHTRINNQARRPIPKFHRPTRISHNKPNFHMQ
ncbi:hypothetical protein BJ138DRAFT_31771 [Hygrophoropsis aurantiaca]|uniref:Uncharacterized protein n=1 Tax=Hygrophoropsis aurantiaca TaxID=72124 RepID=A0ACB8ACZ9_9AGAM|nr:hypothetical protein BJ138DRAFT_31771 [Hygrophoropsis aurantiaca]